MSMPFHFHTQAHLIEVLKTEAKNPVELLEGIKKIPEPSIYYHTHRFLQQHHYLSPEPPNDFAYWAANILNLRELGELLFSVDIIGFGNMGELRAELIRILAKYISNGGRIVDCPKGTNFHFMTCKTFILPTPYIAHNLKDFVEILNKISINSIYFHVFEARMRLQREENDFVAWVKRIGEVRLAGELLRLDPYTITLEGLRQQIIKMVGKYARH